MEFIFKTYLKFIIYISALVGSSPIAPAADTLIGHIRSASYYSFEVSILCASDTLPFDNYYSILHVTSGNNKGDIGSRVFAFWRMNKNNKIFIANPWSLKNDIAQHSCRANTYSNYKLVVSPDEDDSSNSIVEVMVNGDTVALYRGDKSQLIGDGFELQVWATNTWSKYGTASTYLIKDLIYTPTKYENKVKGSPTDFDSFLYRLNDCSGSSDLNFIR
ncbi:unnamed protein product [Oikopleura dioica]|uniref:Uncharacterized protein n=1 Tax=Oikopleura dioica TaxID=34765 RepID=E4XJ72_OIKDI|nr:unnamed protein product [Oikopleura dioica]